MNIVILDGYAANPGDLSWDGIRAFGNLVIYDKTPVQDEAEIISRIGDAEIVLINKTPISATVLAACPTIRYIGIMATGYNIVDVEAAKTRGIPVTNIPAYSTSAVSQLVFAHILAICQHVSEQSLAVHQGAWGAAENFHFWKDPLIALEGKTMGIIGYGQIGKNVAKIAKAFDMNVLACKRSKATNDEGQALVSFDEVLAKSDFISIHCPLFPETTGLINRESIGKMKDGVILINTSRGPIIVEEDVAEALNSGKIYYAGLDVVSREPIADNNPLLTAKNCFITPHIGWATPEARSRLLGLLAENLASFVGGSVLNQVNP